MTIVLSLWYHRIWLHETTNSIEILLFPSRCWDFLWIYCHSGLSGIPTGSFGKLRMTRQIIMKTKIRVICICGSFKFYQEMERAAAYLRKYGFTVIVPQPSHIRHGHKPEELKSKYDKKTLTKWEGEGAYQYLSNIRRSDIVYIFNQGSYVGPAATVEIGYSLALGKPIYARAKIRDITVTNFIKAVVSPLKLPKLLKSLK